MKARASSGDQQPLASVQRFAHESERRFARILDFYGMSVDNVFGRIFMVLADIAFYTDIDFHGWPALFQNVLKRAQLREANYLLGGDPVALLRESGITSTAVGESSCSSATKR